MSVMHGRVGLQKGIRHENKIKSMRVSISILNRTTLQANMLHVTYYHSEGKLDRTKPDILFEVLFSGSKLRKNISVIVCLVCFKIGHKWDNVMKIFASAL